MLRGLNEKELDIVTGQMISDMDEPMESSARERGIIDIKAILGNPGSAGS